MLNRNEAHNELGTIKIHRDSVASIAAIAATEIDGVKCVGKNMKSRMMELLDKKDYSAIKVDFDKNGEVSLEIPLVIKYGFNIPDVASKVQENVRNSLEKMTNVIIKDISINVQAIEKSS
jgi:uncharacterized alkaline shock family protein YloU